MRQKISLLGFLFLLVSQMFFLNEKAYPATIPLQKVNLGVYGAKVRDIAAYKNSGTTKILIAIERPKGV